MIKVENIEVWGFEHAIRGMRNPMNSWDKSDSTICPGIDFNDCKTTSDKCPRGKDEEFKEDIFCIGKSDLELMKRLFKAGIEHRKYLRQIFVSMDITAPLYWWKEFDTYKVGTVANSCSTMHKIVAKKFTLDDFSHEHLLVNEKLGTIIRWLNDYREMYVNWNDSFTRVDDSGNLVTQKDIWWQMIQLLPSSYNQKRTISMNYENAVSMIKQRSNHKLDEWNEFVKILKTLPYVKEIGGYEESSRF